MKRPFRRITIGAALLLGLLAWGCAPEEEQAPADNTDGYIGSGQISIGGEAQGEDINAKTLRITSVSADGAQETQLRFTFVRGSRISGGEEETAGCGVPSYSVYTLDSPARLVVDIDNLAHWDYRRGMDFQTGLVEDCFQHTLLGSPRVSLYFQLSAPARFHAAAEGDELVIRLRGQQAGEEGEEKRYFVTVNAYEEYRSGTIPAETDLSPTFAGDFESILMISPPFQTREEAEAYLNNAAMLYPTVAYDLFRVAELAPGELPAYDIALDYLTAFQTPVVRLTDGEEKIIPVYIPDGLYLCDLPKDKGCLYSKEIPVEEGGEAYQRLYVQRGGKSMPATNFEFVSIEEAKFSPDGRKLAVLERTSSSTHLYVFDADTFELLNDLSEMGFGGNTGAFIWNSLGNIIYAITGVSEMSLHQFDYSIPDETQRHSIVDRNPVDEGSFGYTDGELYFAYATMEEGSGIYRIKPEGGVRKPFMKGERFVISDDARYMAVASTSETSVDGAKDSFLLYEFATGEKTSIHADIFPYDFLWSKDCTRLYYIESHLSGGQTEVDTTGDTDAPEAPPEEGVEPAYPYTLWVYDVQMGESERLIEMSAPDLYAGDSNALLYLTRMISDDLATTIRATYSLDLNTVFFSAENSSEGGGMEIE